LRRSHARLALPQGRRLAGAILCALAAAACSTAPGPVERRSPNIVLITIDTLRRDHLSCYGYARKTTPFLDRLAADAVRFDKAYSTSSWTLPAVVSILTGLDPSAHGMKDGDTDEAGVVVGQPVLGEDLVLLPELLRDRGYQTFGLTANEHLQGNLGFERGFDAYRCLGFKPARALSAPLAEIRARIDPRRPYFLWVHYFDPHTPYDARRPELRAYLGPKEVSEELLGRVQSLTTAAQLEAWDRQGDRDFLPYAQAAYDSCIRLADRAVATLFEALEIGKEDLVLVTADHGEEFREHGRFGHGHALFEELLQVPLLVRLPGGRHAGETVSSRVSLMDLFPTILEIAGIAPRSNIQGKSLLPLIQDKGAARDRVIHASTVTDVEVDSVTIDRWKYIESQGRPEAAMLFDLESTEGEQRNVIADYPNEAEVLRRALAHLRQNSRRRAPSLQNVPLSPERLEALRSLGYVR